VAIHGDGKVEAIELVRNELVEGRAVATDERETVPCGIVFRSVGYRGVPLPGVPFDEGSGTIPNEGGRVEPGLYAAGWIKRGPSGVIGTNKKDATETIDLLLEDARTGELPPRSGESLEDLLAERGAGAVLYAGWQAIDAAERNAGEPHGRPRIKLSSWDALLDAARRA
jgi:ferredoxin--NADP+ reductase